jgi:hypothetical protein
MTAIQRIPSGDAAKIYNEHQPMGTGRRTERTECDYGHGQDAPSQSQESTVRVKLRRFEI